MSNERDLSCQELVELVTDYLEGALPPADVVRFEAHLAGCPHCAIYLDQMRVTVRVLGRLPAEVIPAAAVAALRDHFRHWTRG